MANEYTFAQFTNQYGENTMLVAYEGVTPVAVQYTDRNHDPRTGYGIRKAQPISDLPWVRMTPSYFMVRIDQCRVDTNVYTDTWRRDQMGKQIEHAKNALVHWLHHEERKIDGTPVWALILADEPHRPEFPPVVLIMGNVGLPKLKGKGKRLVEEAIAKAEANEKAKQVA